MMNRRRFLASSLVTTGALALPGLSWATDVTATGRLIPGDRDKVLSSAADTPIEQIPNFRRLMRTMVIQLGSAAHKAGLQVMLRNAPELLVKEDIEGYWEQQHEANQPHLKSGEVFTDLMEAIDGMMVDGLYWGNAHYGVATQHGAATPYRQAAEALRQAGRKTFTVEYVKDAQAVEQLHKSATADKLISYADQEGDMSLSSVPSARPWDENPDHVAKLSLARNWLPVLDGSKFPNVETMVTALAHTSHDLLVVDPFCRGQGFSYANIAALKTKTFGSRRLVLARLPVGLASQRRWYWNADWQPGNPGFLKQPMPVDPNYWMVNYWSDDWKAIISKYFTNLIAIGVDGFLIDAADAYLAFEEMYPID